MYESMDLCVYIDLVHGLMKMCKSSICLSFYESLPSCIGHHHSLWQHPLIRNLIRKLYFDPDAFRILLMTNEWQVLFFVWILFQWELDELILLHVLLLPLYRELLHVLLDILEFFSSAIPRRDMSVKEVQESVFFL
ncbi:hypothetical protein GQ457_07G020050 [Hibiscus cannabinus]